MTLPCCVITAGRRQPRTTSLCGSELRRRLPTADDLISTLRGESTEARFWLSDDWRSLSRTALFRLLGKTPDRAANL